LFHLNCRIEVGSAATFFFLSGAAPILCGSAVLLISSCTYELFSKKDFFGFLIIFLGAIFYNHITIFGYKICCKILYYVSHYSAIQLFFSYFSFISVFQFFSSVIFSAIFYNHITIFSYKICCKILDVSHYSAIQLVTFCECKISSTFYMF
jgi:hypothetical protein